jgi:hypothetical protein
MPDWNAREADADREWEELKKKTSAAPPQPGALEPEGTALLRHRIPDRTYPQELVAKIAAGLRRGDDSDDYQLAVHRALRLLDTTHRTLEKPSDEKQWERVDWDQAVKKITGANRTPNAEARLVKKLLEQGFDYIDHEAIGKDIGREAWDKAIHSEEAKKKGHVPQSAKVSKGHNPDEEQGLARRMPTKKEIEDAIAYCRKNGLPQWRVELLRKNYLTEAGRSRVKNLHQRKKKSSD